MSATRPSSPHPPSRPVALGTNRTIVHNCFNDECRNENEGEQIYQECKCCNESYCVECILEMDSATSCPCQAIFCVVCWSDGLTTQPGKHGTARNNHVDCADYRPILGDEINSMFQPGFDDENNLNGEPMIQLR